MHVNITLGFWIAEPTVGREVSLFIIFGKILNLNFKLIILKKITELLKLETSMLEQSLIMRPLVGGNEPNG